jgi:hypothetical protein
MPIDSTSKTAFEINYSKGTTPSLDKTGFMIGLKGFSDFTFGTMPAEPLMVVFASGMIQTTTGDAFFTLWTQDNTPSKIGVILDPANYTLKLIHGDTFEELDYDLSSKASTKAIMDNITGMKVSVFYTMNEASSTEVFVTPSNFTHDWAPGAFVQLGLLEVSGVDRKRIVTSDLTTAFETLLDGSKVLTDKDLEAIPATAITGQLTVGNIPTLTDAKLPSIPNSKLPANVEFTTITEEGTRLNAKYLGINAQAANSAKLGGVGGSSYLRSDMNDTKSYGYLRFKDDVMLQWGDTGDVKQWWDGTDLRTEWTGGKLVFHNSKIDGTDQLHFNIETGLLQVAGDYGLISDKRVKTNFEPILKALDKVCALNGLTYDRTDIECPRKTGLIAQEVQAVLPEAVNDEGELLSVNYGSLTGLTVEAIKELKQTNDELRLEVNDLKALVNRLLEKQ